MPEELIDTPDLDISEPAAPVSAPEVPTPSAEPGPSDRPADSVNGEGPDHGFERDESGRFRRRAKKDQAGPEDVPRIRELSQKVRERDERLTAQERRIAELEAKVTPKQPTVRYVPPAPKVEFNTPEPTLDQFADKEDPYGEWMLARTDWRAEKRAADAQTQHMQAHVQRTAQEVGQYWEGARATHQQRLMAAIQANPAHYQALQSVQVQPPPLLDWAIMLDNQGADVALFLATHPDLLDEFVLMTDAKPVTEQTVATTQRLLRQRMSAVGSGAAPPLQPLTPAPRPPTPLRTAPMRTTDDPPAEDVSIADHAKYHMPKPRR